MFSVASSGGSLGVIAPVVAAWQERGAVLEIWYGDARGDPATVWLRGWVSPARLESEFDLGPFLSCRPDSEGHWSLVDDTTGTFTLTRLDPEHPVPGPGEASADRPRAGWADQVPELVASSWSAPSVSEELARITGSSGVARDGEDWRFVRLVPGTDAEQLRQRVAEVLEAVLPVVAAGVPTSQTVGLLPPWFAATFPTTPLSDDPAPLTGTFSTDATAMQLARWRLSWNVARWLTALTPTERTWAWGGLEEVSDGLVLLRFERRALGAPVGSLKWLLQACGATGCVPPPYPVDQDGHRTERRPPSEAPVRPTGWERFARHFRSPGSTGSG